MTPATADQAAPPADGHAEQGGPARPVWADAAADFDAWRAGDSDALERMIRYVTPVLWHVARAYGLDRFAAEDVVQVTWLALVRHAAQIRDPQAIFRWLTLTTRREAWRVAQSSARHELPDEAAHELVGEAASSAEELALEGGDAAVLWRHVAQLPDRCRRLLRIVAFEDRPNYVALSADLHMPVGSIGPTRRRCLDRLRRLLADDPEWSA